LAVAVCQRQSDDDKEYSESCASDADWHEWEIFSDAIGLALCGFDRAWIINPEHGVSITKRGRDVYRDQKLMVSCDSHELEEVNYYGFFSDSVVIRQEDEEYENEYEYEYESPFDEAFDQGTEALAQFIDNHTFGIDEEYDKQIIDGLAYRSEYSELLATAIQKDNARVNFSIDYYSQPLMHAIENANDKGAKVLLNAGASPSIPGKHGILPLSKAVRYCSLEVIQLLVENGADINGVTGSETLDYAIPLKNAAFAGNAQAVSFLLDIGAKLLPDNPENHPHFDAQELLYYASVSGDLEIFNSFVKSGATIPMGEEASAKIIEAIVGGKNPAMLRQAFSMGLQLPKTQYHSGIYEQIVKITTDRHDPHVDEGMAIFDLLIANGLDMSRQMDTGWHYGHQAIQYYTRFDALVSDDEDEARIAAKQTLFVLRVIEEVLKTGVDINATYEKQQTMLMEAAGRAQYEIVNYLLARNADPNLKDANGNTALEIAMEERRRKTKLWKNKVKLKDSFNQTILSLGGDPNVQVDTATAPVVTARQSKGHY
jgi:ankyrin repeat protein